MDSEEANREALAETTDEKEAAHVLSEYLDLVNERHGLLMHFLAENCILQWKTRHVRGRRKIQDFFRYRIAGTYSHLEFKKAKPCGPIENRSLHFEARKLTNSKKLDRAMQLNLVTDITSLKNYAESDAEDEKATGVEIHSSTAKPTEAINSSSSLTITPPTSAEKVETTASLLHSNSSSSDDEGPSSPKRIKRSPWITNSRSVSAQLQASTLRRKLFREGLRTLADTSSEDEESNPGTPSGNQHKLFSKQKYLETTGILNNIGTHQRDAVCETPTRRTTNDETVILRLSFRRSTADQSIEFTMIVYEFLNNPMPARLCRNLIKEFEQDEVMEVVVEHTQTGQPASISQMLTSDEILVSSVQLYGSRTPTKIPSTPPATPQRNPRMSSFSSSLKRLQQTERDSDLPATPRRKAARNLRL